MRSFFIILFFVILFFSASLFGQQNVEVFAKKIDSTKDFMTASGDVVMLYNGALLKSQKATYDKKSSLLRLTGDVEMLKVGTDRVFSNVIEINTSNQKIQFSKLLITTADDLWIDATEAKKENETYTIYNSTLSSCNTENPEWTIDFAKANYHKAENYMSLQKATLSFFDVPVFYFPYLAFPTVEERTSGLLFPYAKFSTIEGFSYMQPIYYAPKENWDIEFDPQIRTNRGFGAHLTTRFFDSNESGGRLTLGYFQNNETYAKDYNLNNKHYGLEFLYQSTDFLSESEYLDKYKSGFYVNLTHLNDLEYLNLQKNTASTLVASSLIESRMNAFIYDEEDYLGLYARYSIDTTKRDNGATLQEIPSVQYHSFMKYLWTDKLFYTFDARLHNYTRSTGSTAYQTEFDLPVTYYDTFFNDYLNLAVTENLYLSDVFFSNLETKSSNYRFYRNFHTVELSSDLSKQYGSNVHTIHPSIVYTKPSLEQEKPLKYQDLSAEQQALFITQTERENISTGVSQYYYNQDLEMNLFHRIAYTRFRDVLLEKGDINNEMGYTANNFNLYSNLFYSLDKERIHSLTTSANYNQSDYAIMLTHFYNYDLISDRPETSFLNTSLTYTYNQHNQWIAGAGYDLEQNFNHQWNIGWFHRQKCWGTQLTFGQEQIPNFDSSFRNTMAYFQVTLNPIGAISRGIEKDFAPQGQQQ